MFVNVRVMTQVQDNGLTVPLDAVQQGATRAIRLRAAPATALNAANQPLAHSLIITARLH